MTRCTVPGCRRPARVGEEYRGECDHHWYFGQIQGVNATERIAELDSERRALVAGLRFSMAGHPPRAVGRAEPMDDS